MKVRQSSMPDEQMWEGFFDPPQVLTKLRLDRGCRDVVEFGCGYGLFTVPAARIISGTVHALDIESEMIEATRGKAEALGLSNVRLHLRDFMADGTGLGDASVDYAMVFNILHAEQPGGLLREAYRVLVPGGKLGIIHWNYDASTPRGPAMDIRPRPEQCRQWAEDVGFRADPESLVDLPPHHWGMIFETPTRPTATAL